MLRLLMMLIVISILYILISQILIPLFNDNKIFPLFRSPRKIYNKKLREVKSKTEDLFIKNKLFEEEQCLLNLEKDLYNKERSLKENKET